MQRNYTQLFLGIIIGLIIGLLIGKQFFETQQAPGTIVTSNSPTSTSPAQKDNAGINNPSGGSENNSGIPQKVYEVLKYIRANHQAMDGYVGGRVFTNREKIVPQEDNNGNPITYQEWDVNPKVQGQNRGTERILTGSDGRAWYTNDHYQTFKEIK
ncbi:MAG: ribonuclease domain-containing protein [Ginsengibacter sp.]